MKNVLFWAAILAGFTLALVYYKGLTTDANAVLPYTVQLAELFQGRNPQTGNFSPYA
jgi:hypothetical protein